MALQGGQRISLLLSSLFHDFTETLRNRTELDATYPRAIEFPGWLELRQCRNYLHDWPASSIGRASDS